MTKATTYPLYVNLSASQTRKRLKGYGFGVQRVEAADRHQAVIIHTATGSHLRELEGLFADVLSSDLKQAVSTPLENLRNLGGPSAARLREVGIYSKADLERTGPVLAYRMVKQQQPKTSLNLLWAMAAALADIDVNDLSAEQKARLRREAEGDD